MATPAESRVIEAALRLLVEPDSVVELRALGAKVKGYMKPHTRSGFFDWNHLGDMARRAAELSGHSKGVYFTLNPLKPALLARRANRVDAANEGELAKDKDVLRRRWLLIDTDPTGDRDNKVSSTDEEKAHAFTTIKQVRDHLHALGWQAPILADSGNGYHLLYRVDLPAQDEGMVERIIKALAAKFTSPLVDFDTTVFNPSRICKVPGTLAMKGDHTTDRPHRLACILEAPGGWQS